MSNILTNPGRVYLKFISSYGPSIIPSFFVSICNQNQVFNVSENQQRCCEEYGIKNPSMGNVVASALNDQDVCGLWAQQLTKVMVPNLNTKLIKFEISNVQLEKLKKFQFLFNETINANKIQKNDHITIECINLYDELFEQLPKDQLSFRLKFPNVIGKFDVNKLNLLNLEPQIHKQALKSLGKKTDFEHEGIVFKWSDQYQNDRNIDQIDIIQIDNAIPDLEYSNKFSIDIDKIKQVILIIHSKLINDNEINNLIQKIKNLQSNKVTVLFSSNHEYSNMIFKKNIEILYEEDCNYHPKTTKYIDYKLNNNTENKENVYQIKPELEVNIFPKKDNKQIIDQKLNSESQFSFINKFNQQTDKQDSNQKQNLIFLGTGSMKPSKYRNVSSILFKNILMDCGEGSTHQLELLFSSIDYQNKLNEIDIVYLSHFHADHYYGIFKLLSDFNMSKREKDLQIIAPLEIIDLILESENLNFCQKIIIYDIRNFEVKLTKNDIYADDYIVDEKNLNEIIEEDKNIPIDDSNLLQNLNKDIIQMSEDDRNMNKKVKRKVIGTNTLFSDTILTPQQYQCNMMQYDDQFKLKNIIISKGNIINTIYSQNINDLKIIMSNHQIYNIQTIRVPHGNVNSFAIALLHSNSVNSNMEDDKLSSCKILVQSGDTQPCSNRIKLLINKLKYDRQDQNIPIDLIHECTLDSECANDARMKSHTTFQEAVSVGANLDANLYLTHFSQRFNFITNDILQKETKYIQNKSDHEEKNLISYFKNKVNIAYDFAYYNL